MEANSLCLVDSELSSLLDAPLQPLLRHINAHCNVLRELAGLERVVNLVSLDVSANQLVSMRGLECLRQLKVLNISCNRLEALESLEHLASLQWLDASHNAIADISNVSALGRSARLETVILHGNRLHSCQNLIAHLSSIQHSLKHLSLWTDRTDRSVAASIPDGKPLCSISDFYSKNYRA
ncbi:leucine-rich repeat and coiled-coil domain-containing protein 1-like, partial [Sycon ciliatum]|uniref:leucine-rich repeat and coiled-coil domain-containing protein 1-like n=1 Tax=Sycon ciliatum TaxID=27933 RepID=UPI0031F65971